MEIIFTKHAEEKFGILRKYDFMVLREQVESAVLYPEKLEYSMNNYQVAQKIISKNYVIKVVFKEEYGKIVIITFYPIKRKKYEKNT